MIMKTLICINDKNRPKQIPADKWIKEGESYTVVSVTLMNVQRNKLGLKLAEIELGQSCFPYEYFDADRFAVPAEEKVLKQELVEQY